MFVCVCVFQAEDGIRDLVRSRGLGDVYKRQGDDMVGFEGGSPTMRRILMVLSVFLAVSGCTDGLFLIHILRCRRAV